VLNRGRAWQAAGLAVAVAVVVLGKQAYRDASPGELRWILAPTARLVSVASGTHFVYDASAGWIDRDVTFVIAPVCAGVNFALAAFLALALGALPGMRTAAATCKRLAIAAVAAYTATLIVNTVRIAIAIAMHRHDWSGGDIHQVEGIVVYLGGLCGLYAAARAIEQRRTSDAILG
jgi:exosortase K